MPLLLFYLGLGLLLTLEEAGLFLLPGDISLVAAGIRASGRLDILIVSWLIASAGMVTGASILFYGVTRSRTFKRIVPQRMRILVRYHGPWGVALARLVPGLRNATVFAAAGSRLSYGPFVAGLVPAALIWSGALLLLGWFGGAAMLLAFGRLHDSMPLKLLSFSLLFAAVSFIAFRLRKGSLQRRTGESG